MTLEWQDWGGSAEDDNTFYNSLQTAGIGSSTSPLIVTAENLQQSYEYHYYDSFTYSITFTLTYQNPFESQPDMITS